MFAGTLLACDDMGGLLPRQELAGGDVAACGYTPGYTWVDDGADHCVLPFRWRSALSNRLTAATALGVLAGIVTIPIGCVRGGTDRHVLRRANQWSASGVYLRAPI